MVYDGDCAFCAAWVAYWKQLTGERVSFASFQQAAGQFPNVPRETFATSVRLFLPGGEMRSGAYAVFTALAVMPAKKWLLWAYHHVPGMAAASEAAYGLIARHRSLAYRLTWLLWGVPIIRPSYAVAARLFLKALAAVYLIAFLSFGFQAAGLIGKDGILPLAETLKAAGEYYGATAYHLFPGIFWLNSSDAFIAAAWIAGAVLAALLLAGVAQRLACLGLFLLYLSLVTAGRDFMSFQWDGLLLEAGFLAIFLDWSPLIRWLFRWLLFRLMFMSGAVKLLSGDPAWRHWTALEFHYQTQPLPTPLAWYMQQLPAWFQRASTGAALAIELVVPCLLFFPRRIRLFAAAVLAMFQVVIFLTGNYAFFNLLAIALCLFAVDDAMLARMLPASLVERMRRHPAGRRRSRVPAILAGIVAALVLLLGVQEMSERIFRFAPALTAKLSEALAPFEIINGYGLFAVMSTTRPEIVIEGSDDGVTWREYEFKYKPGALQRPPRWVEPHQPRLDWQMWFAALGNYRNNPWVLSFVLRLLQGSPRVLRLLNYNPFPQAPPHYIRALLYEYRFTDGREKRQTGDWWHRELKGVYLPPLTSAVLLRAGVR